MIVTLNINGSDVLLDSAVIMYAFDDGGDLHIATSEPYRDPSGITTELFLNNTLQLPATPTYAALKTTLQAIHFVTLPHATYTEVLVNPTAVRRIEETGGGTTCRLYFERTVYVDVDDTPATTTTTLNNAALWQNVLVSGTNIKTLNSASLLGSGNIAVEPSITAGTTAQYWRGDKSWQTLNKAAVGLGNVDNTSDANKPVSTAVQDAYGTKVVLGSDQSTTGALGDITGLLISLTGLQLYHFRIVLAFTTNNTGRPAFFTINSASAISVLSYRIEIPTTTTARQISEGLSTFDAGTAAGSVAALAGNIAIIEGIIKVATTGDLQARFSSTGGANLTVNKGSFIHIHKL